MKQSVLIFGGGSNQSTLIKASKTVGVESVVLDISPKAPSRHLADKFYVVKKDDYKQTLEIAKAHKISGLATTQMENPLRLMAKLASELNLNFHSSDTIEKSLDKWEMKKAFIDGEVPCAQGIIFNKDDIISCDSIQDLTFPLIMKPKDGTSSKGVFKLEQFSEIQKNRNITSSYSRNGEIILEEFLEGKELSVECVTYNNETYIIQYTEKFITEFPCAVEMGHLQPANINYSIKNEIDEVVKKAIKSVGINNSVSHPEVILTSDGPKVVEIGPRGGGDYISSYLTFLSTGINLDEAIINLSLDNMPKISQSKNQFSFIKYFSLPAGKKVVNVDDYSDIIVKEDVELCEISVKSGDTIEQISDSSKRSGFVLVKGESREGVLQKASEYVKLLLSKIDLKGEEL